MRKFNMKNARVLYRKGINNFEPRTPYGMGGKLVYKDSGEALPCPPFCAGKIFKTEELENMRDPSRTRQFYNEGIKNKIDLGGNSDMSKFYINPKGDYINTTSTGIPGAVDTNLKRLNQMYLSNNRQMPQLTPADRKNILDEMNKRSFDFQSSDDKIINKYFSGLKKYSGYMKAQLGADVEPTDSLPISIKKDPFKANQTEWQSQSYLNNDMYNRAYNVKYDMQGKPVEPSIPFEQDPFSENWMEYSKALKDYYKSLENDPNNYSHMKKELRPKRPMRGYGGNLNYIKYGR